MVKWLSYFPEVYWFTWDGTRNGQLEIDSISVEVVLKGIIMILWLFIDFSEKVS